MSVRFAVFLVLLALGAAGCNKNFFHASAAAKPGWIYVVGSKNDRAQVWLCPAAPGKGSECHDVDVVEAGQ